jgi:hypothetical protein
VELAPECLRADRPFSCPFCEQIIEARTQGGKYAPAGCLLVFLLLAGGFISLGMHWGLSVLLGLTIAVFLTVRVVKRQRRKYPRVLAAHELRTYQENLPALADFLEELAAIENWNDELDRRLKGFSAKKTYDDSLEEEAIAFADAFRRALTEGRSAEAPGSSAAMSLNDMRSELKAIGRDLRLAAKPYLHKDKATLTAPWSSGV